MAAQVNARHSRMHSRYNQNSETLPVIRVCLTLRLKGQTDTSTNAYTTWSHAIVYLCLPDSAFKGPDRQAMAAQVNARHSRMHSRNIQDNEMSPA